MFIHILTQITGVEQGGWIVQDQKLNICYFDLEPYGKNNDREACISIYDWGNLCKVIAHWHSHYFNESTPSIQDIEAKKQIINIYPDIRLYIYKGYKSYDYTTDSKGYR